MCQYRPFSPAQQEPAAGDAESPSRPGQCILAAVPIPRRWHPTRSRDHVQTPTAVRLRGPPGLDHPSAARVEAQDRWQLRTGVEYQFIDSRIHAWNNWAHWRAEARRSFSRGSVAVGLLSAYRFNHGELGFVVGGDFDVRPDTHVRLRAQVVPSRWVLPGQDIRIELVRDIAANWQASLGYVFLGFNGPDIHTVTATAAHAFGRWSVRLDTDYTNAPDGDAVFVAGAVRLAIPSRNGYVEVVRGRGDRAVLVAIGPVYRVRESGTTGIRVRLLPGTFGVEAALESYSFVDLPGRIALSMAALIHW